MGWSQRRSLVLIGLSSSTWHYRRHPRPSLAAGVAHRVRISGQWLTRAEKQSILAALRAGFARGNSVYQAYHEALDAGRPIASLSSWHRLARAHLAVQRPVRPRRTHRASAIPQLCAQAPMQVWSWDITKLPGPYRGVNFNLYLAVDIFSRAIMAWRVEAREDDQLAKEMFESAFAHHRGKPHVVHSDRGSAMISKTVTDLFRDLGIAISKNRPRISNDNPYSEALFKTAKYRPGYPKWFHHLEQARAWAHAFVHAYNHHHRHSGLAGHTPQSVHDGSWQHVHTVRQAAIDELHATNPSRYPTAARMPAPAAAVHINPPTERLHTA